MPAKFISPCSMWWCWVQVQTCWHWGWGGGFQDIKVGFEMFRWFWDIGTDSRWPHWLVLRCHRWLVLRRWRWVQEVRVDFNMLVLVSQLGFEMLALSKIKASRLVSRSWYRDWDIVVGWCWSFPLPLQCNFCPRHPLIPSDIWPLLNMILGPTSLWRGEGHWMAVALAMMWSRAGSTGQTTCRLPLQTCTCARH